jgi:CRISPR-associated endonuclease Cas2
MYCLKFRPVHKLFAGRPGNIASVRKQQALFSMQARGMAWVAATVARKIDRQRAHLRTLAADPEAPINTLTSFAMHWIMTYDVTNDRLRNLTGKMLTKHGCKRVQKSVYAAPFMDKKDLARLQLDLRRLFAILPPGPADSVLFVPLREALREKITVIGYNNILAELDDPPLQIIL